MIYRCPVRGVLSWADREFNSCHLEGWKPCTFTERYAASPRSFNNDGIIYDSDVIYKLPLLGFRNLPHRGCHVSQLVIRPDKRLSVDSEAFKPPTAPLHAKGKGKGDGAQAKSPPPMRPKPDILAFSRGCMSNPPPPNFRTLPKEVTQGETLRKLPRVFHFLAGKIWPP